MSAVVSSPHSDPCVIGFDEIQTCQGKCQDDRHRISSQLQAQRIDAMRTHQEVRRWNTSLSTQLQTQRIDEFGHISTIVAIKEVLSLPLNATDKKGTAPVQGLHKPPRLARLDRPRRGSHPDNGHARGRRQTQSDLSGTCGFASMSRNPASAK